MNNQQIAFPKQFLILILGGIALIIIAATSTITIDSGKAGVLYRTFGGGVDTAYYFDEGFHFVAPWNKVFIYEVRQQELFEKMSVLSLNGLEIKLDASVWYQPIGNELGLLHKTRGENYLERVIQPSIRSATRSVVGRYTPEQIYSSKREAIQKEIFEEAKKILDKQHVQLNEVLVRDVTLPQTIKTAIENKLGQEQASLEYEFRLEKATKEAERQRIEARGKSDANRILSESLNDKILKDKGIEATLELSKSPNTKVIVIGSGKDGMPLILGNN